MKIIFRVMFADMKGFWNYSRDFTSYDLAEKYIDDICIGHTEYKIEKIFSWK